MLGTKPIEDLALTYSSRPIASCHQGGVHNCDEPLSDLLSERDCGGKLADRTIEKSAGLNIVQFLPIRENRIPRADERRTCARGPSVDV